MSKLNTFREPPSYKSYEPCTEQLLSIPKGVSLNENIWLSLKSVSEVKKEGLKFLKRSYPNWREKKLTKKWKQFRSFIRQAENYWDIAQNTAPKSSPLLYYYSFMNLTKAYLVTKNEDVSTLNIFHGLSSKENKRWVGAISNKKISTVERSDKKTSSPFIMRNRLGLSVSIPSQSKNCFHI